MVTQTYESGPKELKVVFKKKRPWNDETTQVPEIKYLRTTEADVNTLPIKQEKKTVADIFTEIDEGIVHSEKKIKIIGRALQRSYQRENVITEKFISDVESMVTRFNIELKKLQDIFGRIISHMPQVHLDAVQKNIDKVVQNVDPANFQT